MQPLRLNPETGFLESHAVTSSIFDSVKKIRFLELAQQAVALKKFPPVHELCKIIGINHRTFNEHFNQDPKFREAWLDIKAQLQSVYTCELANKAVKEFGTIANLAILKYLENGTWNDKGQIIHVSDDSKSKVLNALPVEIDSEITDNSAQIENKTNSRLSVDKAEELPRP